MDSSISYRAVPTRQCSIACSAALVLAFCSSLACAGCALFGSDSQPPSTPPAQQAQGALVFCNSIFANCTPESAFSLSNLRDLNVVVNWQNLPAGTHAQKITFNLPGGDLYQTFEKSFTVDEGSNGTASTMQALPVAGTWITQRGLTGTWSVSLALDGAPINSGSVQFTP